VNPVTVRRAAAILALLTLGVTASAVAEVFIVPPPGVDLVGIEENTVARFEDTMPDIARRYGLGYEEILNANPGTDPWLPGDGREIVLPTRHILPQQREGIVVNLSEHRLYFFPEPKDGQAPKVISHPISIGQMDWETPLGVTRIVSKVKKPTWYPPESIRRQHELEGTPLPRAVPPGPDNPLGDYAMRLGIPGGAYLIHGTNRPVGVGLPVTHGCIRMYPEDIESLFGRVKVGTPVLIINQPIKTGWVGDVLYLEVHPRMETAKATDSSATNNPQAGAGKTEEASAEASAPASTGMDLTTLTRLLVDATRDKPVRINWALAERTLQEARGMPVAVSLPQIAVGRETTGSQ
jgi:L,D-transpeptidase ErfK/SrfK